MKLDCSYFNQGFCKSCSLADQNYDEQIKKKEQIVRDHFSAWAPITLEPTEQSNLTEFRNRAKLSITGTVEKPNIGITGESDLDQGQDLRDCPIHHPEIKSLLNFLPKLIKKYNLQPYQINNRTGELKSIITYFAASNSARPAEAYLRFVLKSNLLIPKLQSAIPEIQHHFPQLTCISANLQPIPHAILEGPEEVILTVNSTIPFEIDQIQLQLAPKAFVQTHAQLAQKLYQTAANWIQSCRLSPHDQVIELYAGQGAFSFVAAKHNPDLYFTGIEIQEDAVQTANDSVKKLGLKKLNFIQSDAAQTNLLLKQKSPQFILVNPPRAGLKDSAGMILKHRPKHILYSSCNIKSLMDDLAIFNADYQINKIKIFDLFPHTEHFETLILLTLKS
jgi:23S rRNA (uracil747-C5)-methyltransferase